jgi:hypothetical protein
LHTQPTSAVTALLDLIFPACRGINRSTVRFLSWWINPPLNRSGPTLERFPYSAASSFT